MKLTHLEAAMRSQFVWGRPERGTTETDEDYEDRLSSRHRLATDREYECSELMGIIVFTGMADRYGFRALEVIRYLEIEESLYERCIGLFKKYYEIGEDKLSRNAMDYTQPSGRLYLKM